MLVCSQCQFQNSDTNKFCQKCGTALSQKICEQCGTQVPLSAEYCPNCGTATKKKTGSIIGQLLDGRYQVVRSLSRGAFGHTYLAQDTRIPGGRSCVIKHLQPESKDPRTLEKAKDLFHQEAEILAKLGSHNQIPTLWDYFAPDQEFYLVQEFIDGHPLRDEISPAQKWTESQVISLLQDVLGILVFVHNQGDKGVIHRDIKPENIMRRQQDNKLVLIDFGAIKKVGSQQSNPGGQMGSVIAGTRIGTFGYAPPEQNIGKPHLNSDIYALGMVAIEALTGIYPGTLNYDDNTHELLWQHLVSVSTGLAAILTQMVRSRWQDRYQSASEVLQALQQLGNSPHTPTVQATVLNTAQSTPAHELT
jgi:serine/threonine-protein kinase